ncbi:hypothetical protein GCM10011504_47550 [Siccirubricoccus deserti]|nr:hypothetical protein [Siccirubricoccus deserti]GGC63833.1 hypothetical protein GCM10011504_47550 [Siccirubricoccus deserti]
MLDATQARRLRAVVDALRILLGGVLLAGGFIALCWATELLAVP